MAKAFSRNLGIVVATVLAAFLGLIGCSDNSEKFASRVPEELVVLLSPDYGGGEAYIWVQCAGVEIAPGFIATAGHCVPEGVGTPVDVIPGNVNICTDRDLRLVASDTPVVWADVRSDLAFIGDGVDLVGVGGLRFSDPPVGTLLETWGFGAVDVGGTMSCEAVQGRQVVVDHSECEELGIGMVGKICVRNTGNGHQVCGGDSGGPVFAVMNGERSIVGVTSSGISCKRDSLGTVAMLPDEFR